MGDEFNHKSVLLNEVIKGLNIKPAGTYIDGTLGGGGHSYEILKRLDKGGRLIGIDQDEAAVKAASEKLREFSDKAIIIRSNYCMIQSVIDETKTNGVDGILLDLGVSSYQLDTPERGFSYREDCLLDMRMDTRKNLTARDIINEYSEAELFRVIRDYGEDKFAKNIAKHIVRSRGQKSIETTFELNDVIKAAIPARMRQKGHPSKQTYQAIRIELNHELEVLENTLDMMIKLLNTGGRLCIITFHSLEDRIVKNAFNKAEHPCTCPPSFPVCVCGKKPIGRQISRKPILPTEEEMTVNPRSKSAKLRIFEKQ